jgi:CheY-specific phosphatase CheX
LSELSINSSGTMGLAFENNFVKVIKDIMNTTSNLNLIAENTSAENEKKYPSFITGMMVLQGKRDIVLTLTFSKMAAAEIVVSLLGIKYNQIIEAEVYDAVMEITNMVAGRLKTAIVATGEHYQLTTPFVFVGPNHFIETKTRPTGIVIKFTDKHFEMQAGVFFL